jgi:taurine dioxygenase
MRITEINAGAAEVSDCQLAHLDEAGVEQLRSRFGQHGLLFFRDQQLTEQDHIAFARRWGGININRFFAAHPEYPEIALVSKEPDQKDNIGGGWHTDHSYDHEPALGSILVARELPPEGGDTLFADMYQAYEALSDGLKATLESLNAVHSARHIFGAQAYYNSNDDTGDRIGNTDAADQLGDAVHPVVIRHPLSGRKALYVNPGFTLQFEGWSAAESQPLLQYLYQFASSEEFVTRLQWREGTVAFWDNRATWHYALNDYHGHRRVMHRITLEGGPLGR